MKKNCFVLLMFFILILLCCCSKPSVTNNNVATESNKDSSTPSNDVSKPSVTNNNVATESNKDSSTPSNDVSKPSEANNNITVESSNDSSSPSEEESKQSDAKNEDEEGADQKGEDVKIWAKYRVVDAFGDWTGEMVAQTEHLHGTYNNPSVSNANLEYVLSVSNDGRLDIFLYEDGKSKGLTTTSGGLLEIRYNEYFNVDIRAGSNTVSYLGKLYKNQDDKYCLISIREKDSSGDYTTPDVRWLFTGFDSLKIIITGKGGSYNLGTIDTSECDIPLLYYNNFIDAIPGVLDAVARGEELPFELDVFSLLLHTIHKEVEPEIIKYYSVPSLVQKVDNLSEYPWGYYVGFMGPTGGTIIYDCDKDNESGNADGLISSECGWRYLEAAPADLRIVNGVPSIDVTDVYYFHGKNVSEVFRFGYLRSSENGQNLFVNGSTVYRASDCTNPQVGKGEENTRLLAKDAYAESNGSAKVWYCDGSVRSIASLCENLEYSIGGVTYDDWFLPSIDELNIMRDVLWGMYDDMEKELGEKSRKVYWSSSEVNHDPESIWTSGIAYFDGSNSPSKEASRVNYLYIRPLRAF